jgi:hypothetical protein
MPKRKPARETKNMTQTALWLPRDMHERLKKAGGDRGMGDEIRRRLQASFGVEERPRDPITDMLLKLINQIALNLGVDEPWWDNRYAGEVFKSAINELVSELISRGEPRPEAMAKLQTRYGPDEKAETIGRIIARAVLVEHTFELLRLEFDR